MKSSLLVVGSLCLSQLSAALAADAPKPAATPVPQISALVRVLRPDQSTVLAQAAVSSGGSVVATVTLKASDAIVSANGRCAFNLRIDEVSSQSASATVDRIYSNDTLIAEVSKIDLQAATLRSVLTQPYLFAGQNNVKVMLNAASAQPVVGWLRINVDGTCTAPAPKPTPAPAPAPSPVQPGSGDWNTLYADWGYSNYAVTQLKGKGYARYADVVKANTDLAGIVNAKQASRDTYNRAIAEWNSVANDPAFKAAMAVVTPASDRR